ETLLPRGETGYAGKNEEGYYMVSEDESGRKQKAATIRELIRTIEANCRILPGIDLAAIDPQKRKLMLGLFGQHGAESIVLSASPGHILWTDDGILGGYGAHEFGVRRVWTQAVLQWMAHTGALEVEEIFTSTAKLFAWGYQFTSMSINALARAGILAEWGQSRWPLSQCIELFRYENVDRSALINIA